jgi:hypothetical protein
MKLTRSTALVLAALALAFTAAQSRATIAYMISGNTESLLSFDTANPAAVTVVGNFAGAVSGLQGLDFRPANGLLYGYSDSGNALVIVDPTTAFTTLAPTPTTGSNTFNLGIDFNPAADRLRLVNANDQNLRINVDTGATNVDGLLAYGVGDPNFGINPQINEVAYTNNDTNPGTGTQLYYIDTGADALVTTTNPNGGVLTTVGSLGVNTDLLTGFDIFTDPTSGTNSAFAVMRVAGVSSLYSINLGSGAATNLGALGISNPFALALQPAVAVPEPGTALAGLLAMGACGATRIRRRGEP